MAMIDRSDNIDRFEASGDEIKDPERGFSGYLSGFDLATLIQTCALNGITGNLQIAYEGEKGQVFFKQGEIVHALCGPMNGTEAFHRIFGWQGGDIHLEPDVLSELDDVLVRPMIMLLGERWPVYSGLLIMLIALGGLAASGRRTPRRYERHTNRLDEPRTLEFGNPYNWLADYYEVRGVLLQRMRYAYGLDPDDLQRLPPEIVAQLLGDQYLVQFVLQPVRVDPMALQAALADIANWQPPENAELLVDRAEQYLAALPDGRVQDWATPWDRQRGGMGR